MFPSFLFLASAFIEEGSFTRLRIFLTERPNASFYAWSLCCVPL
jgi:hypothetical protein